MGHEALDATLLLETSAPPSLFLKSGSPLIQRGQQPVKGFPWRTRELPTMNGKTGSPLLNTGAMLARYSNDRFRATPHGGVRLGALSRLPL